MSHKNKTNNYTEFCYHFFRNILVVSLPLLIISALILGFGTSHSSAKGNVSSDITKLDNITLTLNVSCTLSNIELTPHTITLEGSGLHRENIGTTKVGVFCNDNNGYNIYAIGSSNNIDGNTDLVVNGLSSDYNIKTGVYSNGNTVSSWGMKLTAGTGTGAGGADVTPPTINNSYNNYNVIPNVYTLVASRPSSTNMDMDANPDVTGSYFTTTYDIYASSVQPAGTYNGKVKYILTHPNTNAPNTINDIDAAFALNGKQKVYQDSKGSYYAMQDMSSEICNSVTRTGETTATQLVDTRDNKLYWVAKLADGHCWMAQNLDFNIDATKTYTHNDTDLGWDPNNFNANTTWKPDTVNGKYNLSVNSTSVPDWSNQDNYPYSADPGDIYYYTSNSTSNDAKYASLSACTAAGHAEGECKHYHAGNYYNWTAAIASNNSSSFNTQYSNAPNSVCPAGWRLPIDTNADQSIYEFGELLYKQGVITTKTSTSYAANGFGNIRKSPLWFVRPGYIVNHTHYSAAEAGFYWSSTVTSSNDAYYLSFSKSDIYASSSSYRFNGLPIRCVARQFQADSRHVFFWQYKI